MGKTECKGMDLVSRMTHDVSNAHVAQLVEHVLGKDEVTRSIRVVGSMSYLIPPGTDKIALGDRMSALSVGSWIL